MTARSDRPGDDEARDAHLVAALRHAPDRDLAPPDALSQRILAHARAHAYGTTRRVEPARAGLWQRARDALFGHPQFAAAFGTLAVATLLGVMWSTREPVQEPPMAPAPAAPPAAVAVPSVVTARSETPAAQGAAAGKGPPRREATVMPAPVAPPAPAAAPAARAKVTDVPAQDAVQRNGLVQAAPSMVESTAAAPAQERRADAAAGGNAVGAVAPRPSVTAAAEARRDFLGAAPAALKAAAPPIDPLARVDAMLDAAAGEPRWQVAGHSVAHGPAQSAWWATVSNATRGRWQREDAVGAAVVPWLVLSSGAAQGALLWIDGSNLRLRVGTEQWKAALPESTLQEWHAAAARW